MSETPPEEPGTEDPEQPEEPGEFVPPGEPGSEGALPLPPDFTPEDPNPPLYIPPPPDEDAEYF